ncbi:DUF6503 family protein [Aestuariivivens sp. NBU2969]|uniref:DUF6503 family protein n=1 Tax=Aestuariivivens sp. NBU2969 TaxID=2873267 RepID=UPI001CC0F61C|nr:DUF6503 family protein [Aestuariivivens sp. NBU2969]
MNKIVGFLVLVFSFIACKEDKLPDANVIVNKSIEVSGGERFQHSNIAFDFRDRHYEAIRDNDYFLLTRTTINESDTIVDALDSQGDLTRFINGKRVVLHDTMALKYKSSVNAVHYFSVLPYRLNDAAVNKMYLGKTTVNDSEYHKIRVTFDKEGGGEDFDDVFVYWININTYKADYIAYSYAETDEIGYRFREAYNERFIGGIRFVDYNNYKPRTKVDGVEIMDRLFQQGQLELLSKIELKNILVN